MFQRVDLKHANATALGILVPQGAKTLVIVRPRALTFDMLPARWDGERGHAPQFCAFTRDEAAQVARRLIAALEAANANPVQTFGDGDCFQVWLRTAEHVWIVCRRAPREAYQPILFATHAEAVCEAEKLSAYVWPAADASQQYYVNTQRLSEPHLACHARLR